MSDCNSTKRTERRGLKEFNMDSGEFVLRQALLHAYAVQHDIRELNFLGGAYPLRGYYGALRDKKTRNRVLKPVKQANFDSSAMKKSSRM